MDNIGDRLKQKRKELGLTIKELHKLTGLSVGNISDMENSKYLPSIASLIPISKVFDCSIDWLITGEISTDNFRDNEITGNYDLAQLTDYEKQIIYKCRSGAKIIFDDDLTIEVGLINGLNRKESNVILKYRALDERNKEELEDILNLKYDRVLNQHVVNENKDTSSTLINGKENMVG